MTNFKTHIDVDIFRCKKIWCSATIFPYALKPKLYTCATVAL